MLTAVHRHFTWAGDYAPMHGVPVLRGPVAPIFRVLRLTWTLADLGQCK